MDAMTPERWRRIKAIASDALDRLPADRRGYVDESCEGDPVLASEVLALLEDAAAATPYFEVPPDAPSGAWLGPGTHIGPYRIVSELATGGMGTVYRAERDDGTFQQRVAIKLVRGGFPSVVLRQRFLEERRILASLEHPHIARVLDGGTTDTGLPYVVMELVDGTPIDDYCWTHGLPLRDRLTVFQQVCGAVQYAHQHLVIHRDIKARNILVTDDGTAKLLDFGIAKLLEGDSSGRAAAHTTLRMLTPESASPEQVTGQPLTVATDVYALGVLLYRLLTRASPYGDAVKNDAELVRAIAEAAVERPCAHARNGAMPEDIEMIVMKALRKEPERRYVSAAQMSEDIGRFLDGRPVLASPDSARYRAGKFVARHRVAVTAGCVAVLAILAGAGAAIWQARIANRERNRAQREFNAVRGLATAVLGEVHDAVAKLPGSTAATELLLRRSTEYLDALSKEAQDDPGLRQELGYAYARLAGVQGNGGVANLGDRVRARQNLTKALALLEAPVPAGRQDPRAPVTIARAYAVLSKLEGDRSAAERDRRRALDTLAAMPPELRSSKAGFGAAEMVWYTIATAQIDAKDYKGAIVSYRNMLAAAEASVALDPSDPAETRNLALTYKQLGAVIEFTGGSTEAMRLYEKALALDQAHVDRDPTNASWRMDLSFSLGSIGAALKALGDVAGAQQRYEQAVALRESVVRDDAADDFARTALARGYDRLGGIYVERGDLERGIDYVLKRVQIYVDRLQAHPDREHMWREYAQAAFETATYLDSLLASQTRSEDRAYIVSAAQKLLSQLTDYQTRWTRDGHTGPLPPPVEDVRKLAAHAHP